MKRVRNVDAKQLDEAIEYFKSLLKLSPREFTAISDEAKNMAFTVSGISDEHALEGIFEAVLKAIEKGISFEDFKKKFIDIVGESVGVTRNYIETVFRTNLLRAYNVGRFKQMTKPMVVKARPYWQYDAVNDDRTRPTHRAMDGRVYRADDPVWDEWYPPNGFNCRCSVHTLSEVEVKSMGLEVKEGPVRETIVNERGEVVPLEPDQGFGYNPGKAMWGWLSERERQFVQEQDKWEPVWPDKEKYSNKDIIIKQKEIEKLGTELLDKLEEIGVIQIEDVFGHKVAITRDGFIRHIKEHESADIRQRLKYLDLLRPTLQRPGLVVLRAYKRSKSGKLRFRRNYIAGYEVKEGKKRFVITVAQFDGGVWTGWTFFTSTKIFAPHSAKWGYVLFKEK